MAGVVGIAAIGTAIYVLRSESPAPEQKVSPQPVAAAPAPAVETGEPLELTNTEGFTYTVGAIKAGVDERQRAFIDYLITNTSGKQAPVEAPGQLFLPRVLADSDRCADQEGAAPGTCSPPTTVKLLEGKTVREGSDKYMPVGAAFVVRTFTTGPVSPKARPSDLKLYVWNVRFIRDRIAKPVPLP